MSVIKKTILVNAPIEKVYAFARDPERWHTWWAGLGAPESIHGNGDAGTVVKHRYTLAGINFPVTTKVTLDKAGPKQAQWKGEIEGPLAGNHEWNYAAKGEQTEVTTNINYTVPAGAVGKIADTMLIEHLQEKAITHTLDNLKLFCESEITAPVHR